MALDRSKFKATSVAKTIKKDNELNHSMGRDGGARTEYIRFNQGANLIRIYPPHPAEMGGGEVFAEPKVTIFLPMMVVQRDERGAEMIDPATRRPILKESVRSVFNSRIHGGTPKDLVEEYISFTRGKLEEDLKSCQDGKTKGFIQSKIEAIDGNFAKKIQGLRYRQAWAMYVDHIVGGTPKFGILEVGLAVKDRLNSLAASTDDGNDPLATDPFTDLETGRAIIVTYNKEAKRPTDYYKTELDNAMVNEVIGGRNYSLPRTFPISDAQLENFIKVTPLKKRFHNVFKKSDFELQLEGLEFFDTKHQMGTFEDPMWLEICEEISAYYPDEEDVPNVTEEAEEIAEYDGDMFDTMTRKELGVFLKANKTGLLIKPTMSDDDVRDMAREWLEAQEATDMSEQEVEEEVEVEVEQEVEEEQPEEIEEEPTPKKTTKKPAAKKEEAAATAPQDRLAAMRAKMKGL